MFSGLSYKWHFFHIANVPYGSQFYSSWQQWKSSSKKYWQASKAMKTTHKFETGAVVHCLAWKSFLVVCSQQRVFICLKGLKKNLNTNFLWTTSFYFLTKKKKGCLTNCQIPNCASSKHPFKLFCWCMYFSKIMRYSQYQIWYLQYNFIQKF